MSGPNATSKRVHADVASPRQPGQKTDLTGSSGLVSPGLPIIKRPRRDEAGSARTGGQDDMTDGEEAGEDDGDDNGLPDGDVDVDGDADVEPVNDLVTALAFNESGQWRETLSRVAFQVVSIQFCQVRAFDTEPAFTSEATGFIVDAERGIIMTNRHVVSTGPFWGHCVFQSEQCDVFPIYRDPVHDFGFLRFDPSTLKYTKLRQLELYPAGAQVGTEIRMVGNDGGEKLNFLSGVISRIDRNAPQCEASFNDFNTFYIQAAAAASGGSSGSPVIDVEGRVVGLQCAGRIDNNTTDYFLPLDRPRRALRCIQDNMPIARGTIQTQWEHRSFDNCRQLGLDATTEARLRKIDKTATGILIVARVLPKGPADGLLRPGDILLEVNGETVIHFIPLDATMDDSVGKQVQITVLRHGQRETVEITVGDLHAITPDRYVSVAGGLFHDIPYQQARMNAIPACSGGVLVAMAGGAWIFDEADAPVVVLSVDRKPTPNLDAFIDVMRTLPDRRRVLITYSSISDMNSTLTMIRNIDRHWYPSMKLCVRNDTTGLWDSSEIDKPLPAEEQKPVQGRFIAMAKPPTEGIGNLVRSFVQVGVKLPSRMDGTCSYNRNGMGMVLDASKGLVLVSRAVVCVDMCDVSITVASSIVVDADVVFLHPTMNFAIVQYDPSLVDAPVESLRFDVSTPVEQGEFVHFFGYSPLSVPVTARTDVSSIAPVTLSQSASQPRYRSLNVEAISVTSQIAVDCATGVLADDSGAVRAIWLNFLSASDRWCGTVDRDFRFGLEPGTVLTVLEQLRSGEKPSVRMLGIEVRTLQPSQARVMGVSESWIERVQAENEFRQQFLLVQKVDAGAAEAGCSLLEGDVLLQANGKLLTRMADLDCQYHSDELQLTVSRAGEVMELTCQTVSGDDVEASQMVLFSGALLQTPHLAVRQQIRTMPSQVYVALTSEGSPASMYQLQPVQFVMEVNGVPTLDLDTFIAETRKVSDSEFFRLRVVSFDGRPRMITMRKNERYFPTLEYRKLNGKWERHCHSDGEVL